MCDALKRRQEELEARVAAHEEAVRTAALQVASLPVTPRKDAGRGGGGRLRGAVLTFCLAAEVADFFQIAYLPADVCLLWERWWEDSA